MGGRRRGASLRGLAPPRCRLGGGPRAAEHAGALARGAPAGCGGWRSRAETLRLRIAACVGLLRAADYDLVDRAEFESAFEEGRKLALESGDDDARVRILLAYSALILHDAQWEKSGELLAEAEAVVGGIDDPELKFVVRGHAGFTAVLRGDQRRGPRAL